jgi:uncharacterized membrane protein
MNLPALALRAVLIAVLQLAGLAAVFVGLAITFPLIGCATWHAYRELAAWSLKRVAAIPPGREPQNTNR